MELTPPDTAQFPHLVSYIDLHDPQGAFIEGLTINDVTVQEDGVTVPVTELKELTPGVQFVTAVSPGASFTIRDGMGISRYEYFLQGFQASTWKPQPAGVDDFSLLTLDGPQLTHISELSPVISALGSYTPTVPASDPGLEILSRALQVASDPATHPGMQRMVLYITAPQESDISLGLQSMIASANQQNVSIDVWVLASPETLQAPQIAQLRNLADQTGGSFWGFSHAEAVPDIGSLLDPYRHIYELRYDSRITTPGSHQVNAQVLVSGETITSPAQSFDIDLQPPAVSLVDPPHVINRSYPSQPTPVTGDEQGNLFPAEQLLRLEIAFPDGYDHSIVSTRLYIDGALAAENSSPPFDEFTWDIRPYTQEGTHTILVEATDNLGLIGKSPEAAVKITVPSTAHEMMVTVSKNIPLFLGAVVVVSGSVLVLALILGGRIRPRPHPGQLKRMKVNGAHPRSPVKRGINNNGTQAAFADGPSSISSAQPAVSKSWWARLPWRKSKETPQTAKAFLVPLVGFDEPTLPAPLQILSDDVTLGTDPRRANLVINDSSIDGVHASIHHDGKSFLITDAGTVAGTWVNYEQVPPAGTELAHMDIIHLGRIGLRFQNAEPGPLRKIVITPIEQKK